MRVTVLRMLATSSLAAFSAATTTAPVNRPGPVRLVREPPQPLSLRPATALPKDAPKIAPPRGSLLDLSV